MPALLISPWTEARVESTEFDHTSLLRYLMDKWSLSPLGARAAQANSIGCALRLNESPRTDTVSFIRVPNSLLIPDDTEVERWDSSLGQRAIHAFADYLIKEMDADLGNAVQSLAWTRNDLNIVAKWRRNLGDYAIRLGTRLNRDLKLARAERIAATENVFERLKQHQDEVSH